MANNDSTVVSAGTIIKNFPRTCLRGIGQVMFQDSAWTGVFFLIGIFWGAYAADMPLVAWGAVVGTIASTLAGYLLNLSDENGSQGLWGFNGVLVGCAFPTFMGDTVWMWLGLVFCAAMTTWVRSAFNAIMGKWGVSSFTFPFVFMTWVFLLAAREFAGLPPVHMSDPTISFSVNSSVSLGFGDLVIYWLKGIAQVFLIDNWVTGIFFLVALACSSVRAAVWAAVSSAVALAVALLFGASGVAVSEGLYGFSAVLTGIALGATFCNFSWRSALWAVLGVIATVFVQAAMNALLAPVGVATLTGPFCVTTWLFLFPAYKMFAPASK